MLVTLVEIVIEVRLLLPQKADIPMLVTPSGIVAVVRLGRLATAVSLRTNTPSYSFSKSVAPQFSLSRQVLLLIKFSDSNMHPENAMLSMLVTLAGIVMVVSLKQSLKASFPMLVKPSGRVMMARLLH